MQSTAVRAREHQVVYCALEVLRLIGERIESHNEVDPEDLLIVLGFMRDVAHRCLDNTEEILRFASLDHKLALHRHALSLFGDLGRAHGAEFAEACRRYTDIVSQSILEDRRCLATLDCDPLILGQFYEWERETDAIARQHGHNLRRLEMKYTIPHCI